MGVIIVDAPTEKLAPGLPGLKFTSVYPQTYPPLSSSLSSFSVS